MPTIGRTAIRSGTSAEWAAVGTTEILARGELGYDTTTLTLKVGDGTTVWNDLPTAASWSGTATLDNVTDTATRAAVRPADALALANTNVTTYVTQATTAALGKVQLATDGEVAASKAVQANDSRLSDDRDPTAHAASHATGQSDAIAPGDISAYTQTEVNGLLTDHSAAITGIHGVTNAAGLDAANRLTWNDTDKTIEFPLNTDVTLQIGQESVVRVLNKTAALIPNGSVVRISGAQGQRPKIELAQADSAENTAGVIGLTTQDIDVDDEGFVTTHGLVRTAPFITDLVPGDTLYLSRSTPGAFVRIKPDRPYRIVELGVCTNTTGSASSDIFVSVRRSSELSDLGEIWLGTGDSAPSTGQVLAFDGTIWENQDNPAVAHAAIVTGTVHGLSIANVAEKPNATDHAIGEWKMITADTGAALNTPDNGSKWAYTIVCMKTDGTLNLSTPLLAGVTDSDTEIGAATASHKWIGMAYRVS